MGKILIKTILCLVLGYILKAIWGVFSLPMVMSLLEAGMDSQLALSLVAAGGVILLVLPIAIYSFFVFKSARKIEKNKEASKQIKEDEN